MKLPEVIDVDDGDEIEIKVFLDAAALFVKFSADYRTLTISDLSSESVLVGNYTHLTVTLSDSRDSKVFKLKLRVLAFGELAAESDSETTLGKDGLVAGRDPSGSKEEGDDDAKGNADEPTSRIKKIDSKGKVWIGFSQKMRLIQNLTAIEEMLEIEFLIKGLSK